MTRVVKLGRKNMITIVGHHWAVQVGDTWYEIDAFIYIDALKARQTSNIEPLGGLTLKNTVKKSKGDAAESGAGSYGGEIVGNTDKTDSEIDNFVENWRKVHPTYTLFIENCQTFALELINWLTDGNYRVPHMLEAGEVTSHTSGGTFAAAKGGIAIARASTGEGRTGLGPLQFRAAGPSAEASAIANTPIHAGVFADAELVRLEVSTAIIGVHFSPNVNTGIGTRDGNLDVHFLGFGARVGTDGLGIDTPLGGATACSVM